MPEIIHPVFAKTTPTRSFCMTENERFGLVFVKTGSINSGTRLWPYESNQCFSVLNSIQFNRLLLGFLTSNIRVKWLFNHSIPLVSFLWPTVRVHPSVDTFAPPC